MRISKPVEKRDIKTLAICAGSGSSVFKNSIHEADVLITGEMSHHDILYFKNHKKCYVILTEHTNSERIYLQRLIDILKESKRFEHSSLIVSTNDSEPIEIYTPE